MKISDSNLWTGLKKISSHLLLLFVLVLSFQHQAFSKTKKEKSKTYIIRLEKKNWQTKLKNKKINSFHTLIIKGKIDELKWNLIRKEILLNDSLTKIEFKDNELYEVPLCLGKINSLEHITFTKNPYIDWETAIDSLCNLPKLKTLQIELLSESDEPDNTKKLKASTQLITVKAKIKRKNKVYRQPKKKQEKNSRYSNELADASKVKMSLSPVARYQNIKPPVPYESKSKQTISIKTKHSYKVKTNDGSLISIPQNAFNTLQGKPYKGKVKLTYTNYTDAVDFLLSGIPMDFDSAGEKIPFISAGMFEIQAFDESNTQLVLAKDKKLSIDFQSVSNNADFNSYYFNDSIGKWQEQNTASQLNTGRRLMTVAYQKYRSVLNGRRDSYDSTKFAERFKSQTYIYNFGFRNRSKVRGAYTYAILNNGIEAKRNIQSKSYSNLVNLFRFRSIRYLKDSSCIFYCIPNQSTHPELLELSRYAFRIPNITKTDVNRIKKEFVKKKMFNDVRVEFESDNLTFILKDTLKFSELHGIELCRYNKAKREFESIPIKEYLGITKRYNRSFARRENYFDKNLKKGKVSLNTYYNYDRDNIELYAWNEAKPLMSKEEKQMTFEAWKEYYKKNILVEIYSYLPEEEAGMRYTMDVMNLGVYNCDQIKRIDNPRTELIAAVDSSTRVDFSMAYVICKSRNSVFTYIGDKDNKTKITYPGNASEKNAVIFIGEDKRLHFSDYNAFRRYASSMSKEIKTTPISATANLESELRNLLDLKK